MKLSVSSYSFSNMIEKSELTLLECIAKVKELGFDAIEFAEFKAKDDLTLEQYAKILKDECDKFDLPVSNFAFGADFINGSNGDFDKEVERIKTMVDVAEILGTKMIRHDVTWGYMKESDRNKGFENALPTLIKGCKIVTQYAKSKGIKTTIENHGYFCQDSSRVEKIINGVDEVNFGALIDIGNFLCVDEDPAKAVGVLAKYVSNVHIKDFHFKSGSQFDPGKGFFKTRSGNFLRGAIVGHGNVPIAKCLSIIRTQNYDGYFALEFEGLENCVLALELGLENLRRYFR